ncbi:MAG: hypothetical protein IH946_00765, partial [Bacteroidetes bacterium]|nr:hypothetical protein [Bacteroidota bacterium]
MGSQIFNFDIFVVKETYAGADQTYCSGGSSVQLNATGGSSFTWTPAAGLSCTSCANPTASPSVSTDYIVSSNLSGGCGNLDTVHVEVADTFTVVTSSDAIICQNEVSNISVTGDGTYSSYTYSWAPSDSLSSPKIRP